MTELNFKKEPLLESLTEKEKKEFFGNCSIAFLNKSLHQVCDELYSVELLRSFSQAVTYEEIAEGRGYASGVKAVLDTLQAHHLEHIGSLKKEEPFDKQEII